MIGRILIPTDMSELARPALTYGQLFRDRLGSQLTFLYAAKFDVSVEHLFGYYLDNVTAARGQARERLRDYLQREVQDMNNVRTLVVDGAPARAIVQTAEDIRADMVIMGCGSTTERVRRDTSRPVLSVLPDRKVAIRKILSQHDLDYAMTIAAAFCAELREISGRDPEHILRIADDYDADLIVIGTPALERITRFARQPVLTVVARDVRYGERVTAGLAASLQP